MKAILDPYACLAVGLLPQAKLRAAAGSPSGFGVSGDHRAERVDMVEIESERILDRSHVAVLPKRGTRTRVTSRLTSNGQVEELKIDSDAGEICGVKNHRLHPGTRSRCRFRGSS